MPDDADASAVTPAAVKRDRGAGEGETTKENDALDVHAEVAGNEEEEDDELEYENRLRRKRSKGKSASWNTGAALLLIPVY
eukprot:scaffold1139_cov202-Prasinococcus_capsulatus_cf.AAC.4